MTEAPRVTVIGGGFAGVECADQLLRRGHRVRLVEMRPVRTTDAHATDRLAEMVCSNSFRSDNPANAVGILKLEMEAIGSLIVEEPRKPAVPAGDALAVDRAAFAEAVTRRLGSEPLLELVRAEAQSLPDAGTGFVVIATGPLTSPTLEKSLLLALGDAYLYFYDAMAPIVELASLDREKLYALSRWGKGGGDDYLNVPLSRSEYEAFVKELLAGEKVPFHDFEKAVYFEGCLPIEAMAERGIETLRHGPMKPFGLRDPRTGREPYAVVQLRQDDLAREHFNLVGFQTKLRVGEQKRIFRMLPGLEKAEFVRFGMLHRNTYLDGPAHLDALFRWKKDPRVFRSAEANLPDAAGAREGRVRALRDAPPQHVSRRTGASRRPVPLEKGPPSLPICRSESSGCCRGSRRPSSCASGCSTATRISTHRRISTPCSVGKRTPESSDLQKRIFRMLPGLEKAEFVRFGMLHRNTYLNAPAHLDALFRWKKDPRVFFAGQLTGVEGYLESAATGLMVGATLAQLLEGREPKALPFSTALGSLAKHVSAPRDQDYTPMNVTFGLIESAEGPDVPPTRDRAKRREEIGRRALAPVARG